jgi:hypothetical protein
MDAFASPSIRSESRRLSGARVAVAVLLTLGLALSLISMPGTADASLDGSWQEMLVHAHYHGLQFGKDLIFTWGPWGFLCSRYQTGSEGALPILIWQVGGQFLIACALIFLTRELKAWRRLLFAAAIVAFHWLFQDVIYFVLIAVIVMGGLMRRETTDLRLLLWVLVLGFLSQLKFTYLLLAACGVGTAGACWALHGYSRRATLLAGGFSLGVVAAWCASGQSLDNLYPYLRRSIELSSGYADAMGIDERMDQFAWGAAVAVACLVFVWRVWVASTPSEFRKGAALFLGFSLFVMWKESYIRADIVPLGGHIFGLFAYVSILSCIAGGYLFAEDRWYWFDGASILCLAGLACFNPLYFERVGRVEWERIYGNWVALRRLPELPADWQRSYEASRQKHALPRIRAAVGRGTVDVYNYQTAIPLLNGLNLTTRPIFQSYSAYTPGLEGWNLRFFQSANAPDFLLWTDGLVDGRYPGQDDAELVASLPGHYFPTISEGAFVLLKRTSPIGKAAVERRLLFRRTVGLSEPVVLPNDLDEALWLRVQAAPNALGRARAFLYKPAALEMVVADEQGRESSWRILPRVATDGFLLSPMLTHNEDLVSLLQGNVHTRVSSFRFESPGDQSEFWAHFDVQVFGLPAIPLHRPSDSWLEESGIVDRKPAAITSIERLDVIDIPEGKALFLHAPGTIAFEVPKGATRFSGDFGLRPGAYTGDGHSAGVDFVVEREVGTGPTVRLWSRYLNPLVRAEDRGTQHFEITLDGAADSKVTLSTRTGPDNVNSWDWSYVAGLKFESGKGP